MDRNAKPFKPWLQREAQAREDIRTRRRDKLLIGRNSSVALPVVPAPPVVINNYLGPLLLDQLSATIAQQGRAICELMVGMNAGNRQQGRDLNEASMTSNTKNIEALVEAITSPKRILHDADGHPVGVETES